MIACHGVNRRAGGDAEQIGPGGGACLGFELVGGVDVGPAGRDSFAVSGNHPGSDITIGWIGNGHHLGRRVRCQDPAIGRDRAQHASHLRLRQTA